MSYYQSEGYPPSNNPHYKPPPSFVFTEDTKTKNLSAKSAFMIVYQQLSLLLACGIPVIAYFCGVPLLNMKQADSNSTFSPISLVPTITISEIGLIFLGVSILLIIVSVFCLISAAIMSAIGMFTSSTYRFLGLSVCLISLSQIGALIFTINAQMNLITFLSGFVTFP